MPDSCRLSATAARQHGAFSIEQALQCGLSYRTLRRWHAAGRVGLRHPGVFVFADSPATWEQALHAGVLAAGPGAVVSHRAAARLWSLLDDDTIELTTPRGHYRRLDGVILHRSIDLAAAHVSGWKGFPVTKPARTIVDLGAVLSVDEVEDVLDRALTRGLLKVAGVEWMLNELAGRGRPGIGVVTKILDRRTLGREPADGLLEPRMSRLLRRAKLPPAAFQHRIYDPHGRFLAKVDFAYPELLLAIEVDGFETHGTPRAMSKDFVRQNGLVPYGWRVLRFTWEQVVHQPEYVAGVIGRTLAALAA